MHASRLRLLRPRGFRGVHHRHHRIHPAPAPAAMAPSAAAPAPRSNNSKLREKGKKDEGRRLREFVEAAYKCDPRVLKKKEDDRLERWVGAVKKPTRTPAP